MKLQTKRHTFRDFIYFPSSLLDMNVDSLDRPLFSRALGIGETLEGVNSQECSSKVCSFKQG